MNTEIYYTIRLYDHDTGELKHTVEDIQEHWYKYCCDIYHHLNGYAVKVYDQTTGDLVYTLGI